MNFCTRDRDCLSHHAAENRAVKPGVECRHEGLVRVDGCVRLAFSSIIRNHHQKPHVDALDPVSEEVKVVNAVVHALHVLEDVGPGVVRGAKGGEVARLQDHKGPKVSM